jgi:hypothetical protein
MDTNIFFFFDITRHPTLWKPCKVTTRLGSLVEGEPFLPSPQFWVTFRRLG